MATPKSEASALHPSDYAFVITQNCEKLPHYVLGIVTEIDPKGVRLTVIEASGTTALNDIDLYVQWPNIGGICLASYNDRADFTQEVVPDIKKYIEES